MTNICPFFKKCGGCLFQDVPKLEYLQQKKKVVEDALRKKGITFPVEDVISIPAHTRRRATFAYVKGKFGFNAYNSHQIVEITECRILKPELEQAIPTIRQFIKTFGQNADVAVLSTDFGLDITLISPKLKKLSLQQIEKTTDFCQKNPIARFVVNDDILYQKVQLPFPPNVFMQPSEEGQKTLIDLVLRGAPDTGKAADLFCGLGTFTKPLHDKGLKTTGYDLTSPSIDALKKAGYTAETRDLFRNPLMADELNQFDFVVLDPARAGAQAQCIQLAKSTVPMVAMVSCHTGTLARDLKVLTDGGYTILSITPVDQFIWSNHIETVTLLKK